MQHPVQRLSLLGYLLSPKLIVGNYAVLHHQGDMTSQAILAVRIAFQGDRCNSCQPPAFLTAVLTVFLDALDHADRHSEDWPCWPAQLPRP